MNDAPAPMRLQPPGRPPHSEPELGPALRALGLALALLLRRAGTALLRRGRDGGRLLRAAAWRAAQALSAITQSLALIWAKPARTVPAPPPRLRRAPSQARPIRRSRLRRRLSLGLAAGTVLILALVGFLGYCAYTLPLSPRQAVMLPPPATIFADDHGKAFAARGVFKGESISPEHLPKTLVDAVVAIEDRRFFEHPGIDLWGIGRAAVRDLVSGAEREGASTITQQLARRLYLSPRRSLIRKVQEAMLAVWLEARLSKQEILARYLDTAYFGAGAYGADAAARRYFGKNVQSLDLAEAAMLGGLIQAPSALAPTTNPEAAVRRADTVLGAMVEARFISKQAADAARAHPPTLAVPPSSEPGRNYFVDAAENELKQLLGTPLSDLTVGTTLDPAMQDAAERIVQRWLAREGRAKHVGQAALVALAPDGKVLAMVGGRDYDQSQFNRVTQARRQAGSLFKLFVYLTAFSNGYTPDSVLNDQPIDIGKWAPEDFERRYRGAVTLRTAFADSINTVAAQLGQLVGIPKIIQTAQSLGVTSPLPNVPSLAIGTADVTLLEMTAAMDAVAVGTRKIVPYTVASVAAHGKTPLYRRAEVQVESPDWKRVPMMDVLQAVVNDGTGKAARLDRPVGGKTGTGQDYRNAWFIGFTTDFVVGVWVGNDDNSPTKGVVGGDLPARIWHDFVAQAERIKAREPSAASAPPGEGTSGRRGEPAETTAAVVDDDGAAVSGVPLVVDTGTLLFKGQLVHLFGVEGQSGSYARDMARYIAGRPVTCRPAETGAAQYRCQLGDYDLAEAVLYNGGGRAAAGASDSLRSAEEKARLAERGIWRQ